MALHALAYTSEAAGTRHIIAHLLQLCDLFPRGIRHAHAQRPALGVIDRAHAQIRSGVLQNNVLISRHLGATSHQALHYKPSVSRLTLVYSTREAITPALATMARPNSVSA
jgi:hypothetical protein